MAKDNTQQNAVPEPIDLHIADGDGHWQRDEPVKLSGFSTEDPINSGAWEKYDQFQKGK